MSYQTPQFDITPSSVDDILALLVQIHELLPGLIGLTKKEKRKFMRMGAGGEAFIKKGLSIATDNPQLAPSFISVTNWQSNYDSAGRLRTVISQLKELLGGCIDTEFVLRGEALNRALRFYAHLQNASESGVPGLDDYIGDLQKLLPRTGKPKKLKTAPEAIS